VSLLETIRQVRKHLEENGRVSLRMLRREFSLNDETLADVIEELVDIQRVARREENALAWAGTPTTQAIPTAPTPPSRETPKHLADKIRQSKAAVEGERKQVTVLFADVKGSMELAEALDPEAFSKIMSKFFAILTDGVERFEGFVDKFTGDGIMALFGAPIAHEDHAQRACYAALHLKDEIARYATELKREHGLSFSTRMGLNSGEVVVGNISEDLRMDYTAQGHTLLATDGVVPRAEIESALARAEQLVESIAGRSLSPRILEQHGRLAAALGDAPAADRALREALDLYRASGAAGRAERLGREIGA